LPFEINTKRLANAFAVETRAIRYKIVHLILTSLRLLLVKRLQLRQLTIQAMVTTIVGTAR